MQSFGSQLRDWRQRRGWSQLDLAAAADISQRHLSFLEQGRSAPSREMVGRLATVLGLPLRQHNGMLLAAGFAPAWPERDLAAPDLTAVADALDFILRQQEPYPALVVDRQWNILKANAAAVRLVEFLLGPGAAPVSNLADALASPDVFRPYVENWDQAVRHFVRSVEADSFADGSAETAALLERLLGYRGVRLALRQADAGSQAGPVLPLHFRKGRSSLRTFTTLTTLGTAQDVTLQELRIEAFFPLDDATDQLFRGLSMPLGVAAV